MEKKEIPQNLEQYSMHVVKELILENILLWCLNDVDFGKLSKLKDQPLAFLVFQPKQITDYISYT